MLAAAISAGVAAIDLGEGEGRRVDEVNAGRCVVPLLL